MASHLIDDLADDREVPALIPDALELADLLRPSWPGISADLRESGVFLNEGDDDDGSGDGDDSDDGDDGDAEGDDDSGSDDDEDQDDDDSSDDEDDDDDEDLSDAEKRARRAEARAREEAKKRRAAERKLKRQEKAKKKAEGRYKEMYEEEKGKREALENDKRDGQVNSTVERIAKRLNFRNPSLAVKLSDWSDAVEVDDGEIEIDEDVIERKLKKLAKDDDYLVDKKSRQSDDAGKGDRKTRRNGKEEDDVKPGMGRMRSAFETRSREGRRTERVR